MATYTAAAGGGNWDNPTTWGGAGVPTTGDIVLFNATSGNVTVTSGAVCSEINFNSGTAYAGTITFTNTLTIAATSAFSTSGNITLSPAVGFTIAGSNGILWTSTGGLSRIFTSNGKAFNRPFVTGGNGSNVITLTGDFTVSDINSAFTGLNGSNLIITGNVSSASSIAAGTSSCILAGVLTTWNSGASLNRVIFNSTGTITILGTVACYTSITWTQGTLVTTGSTMAVQVMTSISLAGKTLNNMSFSSNATTTTVTGDFNLTGNLTLGGGGGVFNGTGKVFVSGNVIGGGNGGSFTIEMNGTSSTISGTVNQPVIVATSGTITVGTSCDIGNNSNLTLTSGTLNLANNLTRRGGITTISLGFILTGSGNLIFTNVPNGATNHTFFSNGISWPNSVQILPSSNVSNTLTLNDNLTVLGSFTTSVGTSGGQVQAINGNSLFVRGNLTIDNPTSGTTNIFIFSSGTTIWSGTSRLGNNLTINKTAGSVTINGTVYFGNSKTLTYTTVSGTFTTTGSTLRIPTLSGTVNLDLNAAGTGFNDFQIDHTNNNNTNVNLISNASFRNVNASNPVGGSRWSSIDTATASTLSVRGDYTQFSDTRGNSKIIMVGTGNITAVGPTSIDFEINSPSGIITFTSMTLGIGGASNRTLKYTAAGGGFITTGSTLTVQFVYNLDLAGTTWGSLVTFSQNNNPATITLLSNATFSSIAVTGSVREAVINGAAYTISCTGNVSNTLGFDLGGTATLAFTGSSNATWTSTGGSYSMNTVVNKSGVGTLVTAGSALTWGTANRSLTLNTLVNFSNNANTFTLNSTPLTINNPSASQFNNMTIPNNTTLNINGATTPIVGTLSLLGSATFAGAFGWTCGTFTCTTSGSTITLQNINANPSAQYTITSQLSLIGTLAQRIILQAAGSASFTGTITPVGQLNVTAGIPPSPGMTLSHAAAPMPDELFQLLPARPVITSIITPGTTFGITPSAAGTIGSRFMRAGYKAIFTLSSGATQNVTYVTTQDIDSSNGLFIFPTQSAAETDIFRTLYWGQLLPPENTAIGWLSVT